MALFCHAIELMLKSILLDRAHMEFRNVKCMGHQLSRLWREVLGHQDVLKEQIEDEEFYDIAIEELDVANQGGAAFRYARDKNGNAYYEDWPRTVNRERLLEVCQKLFHGLQDLHGRPDTERRPQ